MSDAPMPVVVEEVTPDGNRLIRGFAPESPTRPIPAEAAPPTMIDIQLGG